MDNFKVEAGRDAADALADAISLAYEDRTQNQHQLVSTASSGEIKAAGRKLEERRRQHALQHDYALRHAQQARDHAAEPKQQYGGEATRSVVAERYDLIPAEIDQLLAQRFSLGAEKHGEGNWKTGDWTFIVSCYNHAKAHEVKLRLNGPFTEDDNLAAILWNWGVLAWFRKHRQEEYEKAMSFIGNY